MSVFPMKNVSITEIMSRQVHYLSPNDDVMQAKKMMDEHKIHHLPILLDDKLVGVLSYNDLQNLQYLANFIGEKLDKGTIFKSLSVHEVMTKDVVSIKAEDKIADAVLVFSNADFHCLPVMDEKRLVGIVSAKDVFRFLSLDE